MLPGVPLGVARGPVKTDLNQTQQQNTSLDLHDEGHKARDVALELFAYHICDINPTKFNLKQATANVLA